MPRLLQAHVRQDAVDWHREAIAPMCGAMQRAWSDAAQSVRAVMAGDTEGHSESQAISRLCNLNRVVCAEFARHAEQLAAQFGEELLSHHAVEVEASVRRVAQDFLRSAADVYAQSCGVVEALRLERDCADRRNSETLAELQAVMREASELQDAVHISSGENVKQREAHAVAIARLAAESESKALSIAALEHELDALAAQLRTAAVHARTDASPLPAEVANQRVRALEEELDEQRRLCRTLEARLGLVEQSCAEAHSLDAVDAVKAVGAQTLLCEKLRQVLERSEEADAMRREAHEMLRDAQLEAEHLKDHVSLSPPGGHGGGTSGRALSSKGVPVSSASSAPSSHRTDHVRSLQDSVESESACRSGVQKLVTCIVAEEDGRLGIAGLFAGLEAADSTPPERGDARPTNECRVLFTPSRLADSSAALQGPHGAHTPIVVLPNHLAVPSDARCAAASLRSAASPARSAAQFKGSA